MVRSTTSNFSHKIDNENFGESEIINVEKGKIVSFPYIDKSITLRTIADIWSKVGVL